VRMNPYSSVQPVRGSSIRKPWRDMLRSASKSSRLNVRPLTWPNNERQLMLQERVSNKRVVATVEEAEEVTSLRCLGASQLLPEAVLPRKELQRQAERSRSGSCRVCNSVMRLVHPNPRTMATEVHLILTRRKRRVLIQTTGSSASSAAASSRRRRPRDTYLTARLSTKRI